MYQNYPLALKSWQLLWPITSLLFVCFDCKNFSLDKSFIFIDHILWFYFILLIGFLNREWYMFHTFLQGTISTFDKNRGCWYLTHYIRFDFYIAHTPHRPQSQSDSKEVWGCLLLSGVGILHFWKDWWKFIQIHQCYTMPLSHMSNTSFSFQDGFLSQLWDQVPNVHRDGAPSTRLPVLDV